MVMQGSGIAAIVGASTPLAVAMKVAHAQRTRSAGRAAGTV